MATLPPMLATQAIAQAVSLALDSHDRFVAAQAGAHGSAVSHWSGLPRPTEAQLKANDYTTGAAEWHGLPIRIENPAHSVREGKGEDGKTWRNLMQAHYGYFEGTRGADGDEIDVFLGPLPESRRAWVINQRNADGSFDEHKVLLGFHDARAAEDAYRLSYTPGWDRYGAPVPLSLDQLKWWLSYGDHTAKLTPDQVPPEQDDMNTPAKPALSRVLWDSAAMPACQLSLADVIYTIQANDADEGLVLDAMTMADVVEGCEVIKLDALVTEAGRLKPKLNAMLRIMEMAGNTVKPVAFQISDPVKRYGGVHVAAIFELSDGQTVTVWFHNPDSTPSKLTPADELVSWKWQLNKKDITIVVAPEQGTDLNLREVSRRVMRLAEKNSPAFARVNAKRAEKMAEIQGLRETLTERQGVLAGLHQQIEVAKVESEDRKAAAALPAWRKSPFDPTSEAGYWAIKNDEEALAWHQDVLDSQFTQRLVAVRNALRGMGWEGERFGTLTKGGATLQVDLTHTGAGRNVVAVSYRVTGNVVQGGDEPVRDFFNVTPEELAADIDGRVKKAAEPEPQPEPLPIVPETPSYVEWERALTDLVIERMEVSNGDAQGLIEAQDMMQRGILKRLHEEGVSAETAYQRLFGDENPVADDEQVKPDPISGIDSISAEAAALLRGNPMALATAQLIEREVKSGGGAVSWVETNQEPAAPILDSALIALDAVGSTEAGKVRAIFELTAKDWRAGYAEVEAYGAEKLADDIRSLFIDFGINALKKDKPGNVFLGSMVEGLIEDFEKSVLGGVSLNKLNAGQNALRSIATVAKKIIDTAWGKGSFDYLKFKNSRASLKGEYPDAKTPAWAKAVKMDGIDGVPIRERFAAALRFDGLFELDGARYVRGDITYKTRPLAAVTINGEGQAFFTNADGTAFIPGVFDGDGPQAQEDAKDTAKERGLIGWTSAAEEVVGELFSASMIDPINDELDDHQEVSEEGENSEEDGFAPAGTILDRTNEHWKQTLNDARAVAGGKTVLLGTMTKGGLRVRVTVVARRTNRADWYVVLTKEGQSKPSDNIPYPAINGAQKLLKVAGLFMGYVNAEEDGGAVWKIAPPGYVATGAEAAFDDYSEKVQMALEAQGATTSDAQAVIAANGAQIMELFKAGVGPSDAAKRLGTVEPEPKPEPWTANLVSVEGVENLCESRGIKLEVWGTQKYSLDTAVTGATLEFNGVRATLEFKQGSGSYSLRTIGDVDGQLDASGTVLSELLDKFVAFKPAAPEPTESAEVKFLREVKAGVHDALGLSELLAKIEASIQALQNADALSGDADLVAGEAITHWVNLDEKANG